jgi:pterin-4a-carbinolamine dehydratase
MTTHNRFPSLYFALLFGMLGAACSSDDGATPDAGSPDALAKSASDKFWNVYWSNDYGHIGDVESALEAAIAQKPDEADLYGLLAAAHWWHVSESRRDPHPDQNVLVKDLPTAVALMQQAAQLDPDEDHYPGFIGVTTVHVGVFTHDANLVSQGDRLLLDAVYRFPEFNGFNAWAAHNADPKDSDSFRRALDALWGSVDACVGATIDRNNPDAAPYMHLATAHGRKKVCWDDNGFAPHAFEGIMLNLGSGLVKAGATGPARIAYENAKLASGYSTWPYRGVLESLLASDLDARAALYADADPNNDPPPTGIDRSCIYCHAKVPEP